MKSNWLRILSTALVIALLINMLPMSVFAEEFRESIANNETVSEEVVTEDTYVVSEVIEKRTEYSKEFLLSNGLHMATVYADPVHYETDSGWEEIDNTLKSNTDGTYSNTEGIWDVSLPQQLSDGESVTIEKDGYTLSFSLTGELNTSEIATTYGRDGVRFDIKGAKKSHGKVQKMDWEEMRQNVEFEEMVPEKSKSRLTYSDVYENTNIIYDLDSNTVKESIVLESYSDTLQGYTYTLEVGTMIPVLEEDGQITLYDESRENIVMVMPAPYLVDDAGEYNYDIEVQLTGSGSTYTLNYILPTDWLAAEDRAWPVVVDPWVAPALTTNNICDATVTQKVVKDYKWGRLEVGYDKDYGITRTFLMYDNLPALTSSDVIIQAKVSLLATTDGLSDPTFVGVHKVNDTWESNKITWSSMPGFDKNIEDYVIADSATRYEWNITDIARDWYATGNTGMMFKASNENEAAKVNEWQQFYSSDASDYNGSKPTLVIYFRNNNGLENYWDYTTSSAGRAGTGYVNNFTGNMTFIRSDIGFGGNRMPVSINHVYNLNDVIVPDAADDVNNSNNSGGNSFGMGLGWRTNYNQLLYKWEADVTTDGTYYVWEDEDGTDHYFELKDGEYKDDDGLELTLTTTGSGKEKYKITNKYGACWYFDTNGRLTKMTNNQKTASSITISYTTSTSKLISTITDGVGRKYNFIYSDDLLSRISYTSTGDKVISYVDYTYKYEYESYRLETVKYKDGKTCTYDYSVKGLLWSAQDIDGYILSYTYTTGMQSWQPYRTLTVSASDGSADGGSLSFSYVHNQTTITDHNGNKEILQFNDLGNLTCIQDDEGRAQYGQYAYNTGEEAETVKKADSTAKANQLRLSSKLQYTVSNRTIDGSMEIGNPWAVVGSTVTTKFTTEAAYIGNRSLKVTNSTDGSVCGITGGAMSVAPGKSYTFSCYVKGVTAGAYLLAEDGTNQITGDSISHGTDWTRLQVTYTNTTDTTKSVVCHLVTSQVGYFYVDCVQREIAASASRYNMVYNGDFATAAGSPAYGWNNTNLTSSDGYVTLASAAAPQLESHGIKVTGSPSTIKHVNQTVYVSGSKGDSFVFAGWAQGNSVPLDIGDREFAIRARFNYTDGTTSDYFTAQFNPDTDQWQYASGAMVAKQAYNSVLVQLAYDYNVNTAYFDGIQLYKEEFGTSYTYNEDGTVKSVEDIQGQITSYEYDTNSNLTQILQNNQAKMTYTYDGYHNVKTSTSDEGLVYYFNYDAYGNNTEVYMRGTATTLSTKAVYTTNGNYLDKSYDTSGKVTDYDYDSNTGVLLSVKYPEDTDATKTTYTYDTMYRMASATAKSGCGYTTTGALATLSATYTYTDDLLTKIQTGSTTYNFTYGAFGLRTAVKVGTQVLAQYQYTNDENRYLNSLDYSNGDKVEYTYDKKGRVTKETYKDGDTVTGSVSYVYNNDGSLAKVIDSTTGGSITYYYDLTGRMVKYKDSRSGTTQTISYSYDTKNNLSQLTQSFNTADRAVNRTAQYDYDDDNRLSEYTFGGSSLSYEYDAFNRLRVTILNYNGTQVLQRNITYQILNNTVGTSNISRYLITADNYGLDLNYTYDDNGNITSISDGTYTTTYEYDQANQLIRENNQAAGYTRVWAYDNSGNIENRRTFAYTTGEIDIFEYDEFVDYQYTDSNWGDLLTHYGDKEFSYDSIGNLLSDGDRTYTWERGRQLAALTDGAATWTYTYNNDGLRTMRTDGTNTYRYTYLDGQLSYMTINGEDILIAYDGTGQPLSIHYDGTTYFYVTNLQGDVVAILDAEGNQVVGYTYDAWGNILSTTGTMATTLGAVNPLRYRGYVYDRETGLYYLQSRYYDPDIGRFINADDILCTDSSIIFNNLFSYCENNPVMGYDPAGHWNWGGFLAGVAIAAVGILTVAAVAATGGAAAPLAVAATKAVVATVGLALAGTGAVTSYAAAAEKTMVVDIATSNGSTHDKTGYSVVIDFETDSVGIDTYYHYGKTTDGYGVSYGVGLVEGYENPGDYGGYFADAGAVYSYNGINLGIDVCTDPSAPFSNCSAVMGTFGFGFPEAAAGRVSVYAGLDYYLPLSYIEWG